MRKTIFALLLMLLIPGVAFSQKEIVYKTPLNFGKAFYQVVYGYHYEDNKVNPGEVVSINNNMVLLIGPEYSQYQRYEGMIHDSIANEYAGVYFSYQELFALNKKHNLMSNDYYLLRNHLRSDSLTIKNTLSTFNPEYVVYKSVYEDAAPEIEWNISDEKKLIGNIEVTKATGKLRGREWTAWFAESIPYPEGPWELTGLPGLILEAYDKDQEHEFYLIEAKPVDRPIFQENKDYEHTTRESFRKYRKGNLDAKYAEWKSGKFPSAPFMNFIDKE